MGFVDVLTDHNIKPTLGLVNNPFDVGVAASPARFTVILRATEVAMHSYAAISDRMRNANLRYTSLRPAPELQQEAIDADELVCATLRRVAGRQDVLMPGSDAALLFLGSLLARGRSHLAEAASRFSPDHVRSAALHLLGSVTARHVDHVDGMPVSVNEFADFADPQQAFGGVVAEKARMVLDQSGLDMSLASALRAAMFVDHVA